MKLSLVHIVIEASFLGTSRERRRELICSVGTPGLRGLMTMRYVLLEKYGNSLEFMSCALEAP